MNRYRCTICGSFVGPDRVCPNDGQPWHRRLWVRRYAGDFMVGMLGAALIGLGVWWWIG